MSGAAQNKFSNMTLDQLKRWERDYKQVIATGATRMPWMAPHWGKGLKMVQEEIKRREQE